MSYQQEQLKKSFYLAIGSLVIIGLLFTAVVCTLSYKMGRQGESFNREFEAGLFDRYLDVIEGVNNSKDSALVYIGRFKDYQLDEKSKDLRERVLMDLMHY